MAQFSKQLENWLKSDKDKTLGGLIELFGEKAFAIIFLILMALPALPLPTGGVTHITEIITLLVAVQMIAGRSTLWLPEKWRKFRADKLIAGKAGQKLIAFIKWFERRSRQRGQGSLGRKDLRALLGVIVAVFTVAAFVAPPFSGLDTLPALGVVIISLGIILEDAVIVVPGIFIGLVGIGVEIALGDALIKGFKHFI